MSAPRFLVIEGHTAEDQADLAPGETVASESYAALLRELSPGATADICYPADEGGKGPDGALDSYDGVALTGSELHVYDGGGAVTRQIDLVRAVLGSGTPLFGSCWGLQILTAAAGGTVRLNPKGFEIGIGRRIRLTEPGRAHPMYRGKADVFDAVAVHRDEVETLAPGMIVLATNDASRVQSVAMNGENGIAWATQYHPEFTLREMAGIIRELTPELLAEGFFPDEGELRRYAWELDALHDRPIDKALAWRHGLDATVLDKGVRTREVANWIEHQVLPIRAKRGRG
jgi:GMP synthase (glutamine-hydrolysing)